MRVCFLTIRASRGMTMPVCGGVEGYNERSLCVKYHSQGVQTSFYEPTPSASDSLGYAIPERVTEDSGNARANIHNASKERNLRNISRHSRVLFECIPSTQGFWRVASSYIDLKQLNHHIDAPHFCMHTISSVQNTVERGDYAFKIDLQDAYFLRFAFENKVYQFRVLPFGLNTAPQVFTHLGHTEAACLHLLGISDTPPRPLSVITPPVSVITHTEHGRPHVK